MIVSGVTKTHAILIDLGEKDGLALIEELRQLEDKPVATELRDYLKTLFEYWEKTK